MITPSIALAVLLTVQMTAELDQDAAAPPVKGAAAAQEDGDCPVDLDMRPIPADAAPAVMALLSELELAHKAIYSFEAKVTFERIEDLLNRRVIQRGELLVDRDLKTEGMRFAVLFDEYIFGPIGAASRKETKLNHYIFDGRWLAEIDHERKQFIKRELVPPGQKLNPLKLGEGPIPLPFGQARDEVLRRFVVSEVALPEKGLLTQLSEDAVDGLRLVPRPGVPEAEEYDHIDIFYDKTTRLPIGIRAALETGDFKTVLLKDAVANPSWDDVATTKLNIQEPDPAAWNISTIFWQGG